MKKTKVRVPWAEGLHTRPATKLVHLAREHRSAIQIRVQDRIADARSILSILLLCATFGTLLDIEVFGDDEDAATSAIERLFGQDGDSDDAPRDSIAIYDERQD